MSGQDVISFPQFAAKIPQLVSGVTGLIKGLKVGDTTDKTKPVGLGKCLQDCARANPQGTAIAFEDREISYREFDEWTNRIAHCLQSAGIRKGDAVAVMIENRPELLAVITGCAKIGAISALVNTSQRGKVLCHSINLVEPKMAIIGEELIEAYQDVESTLSLTADDRYFVADSDGLKHPASAPEGWHNLMQLAGRASDASPATVDTIFPDDPCFYIYTSGTTGMPKAVVFNHGRFMKAYGSFGFAAVRLNSEDRMYVCMPFYHATALAVCWGSVLAGNAGLVIARRFSASRFWQDIRDHRATAFGYVGELCRYLIDQPPSPRDADNQVRVIVGNGLRPTIWKSFKQRFGIPRVMEFYASSEGNIGFTNLLNFDNTVGMCPFPYAIVQYDQENETPVRDRKGRMVRVRKGEAGLLIGEITDKTPFHGYTDAEKTRKSILTDVFEKGDAWFNTGDLMRDIGFKHAQFVDRLGDTFRWKGENVSTTEVERIVDGCDHVSETVAYGVEIPHTNGRAGMASVRLNCDIAAFDFQALLAELRRDLGAYAIPVFLRISDDVEKTGTFKHKKAPLKQAGFDIHQVTDLIYVWLPGADTYVPLTREIHEAILAGHYRF